MARFDLYGTFLDSGTAAAFQVPELYAGRIERSMVMNVYTIRLLYADLADDVSRASVTTIAEMLGIDRAPVQLADEILLDLGLTRRTGPDAYAVTGQVIRGAVTS